MDEVIRFECEFFLFYLNMNDMSDECEFLMCIYEGVLRGNW